jgi:hypothetical protein
VQILNFIKDVCSVVFIILFDSYCHHVFIVKDFPVFVVQLSFNYCFTGYAKSSWGARELRNSESEQNKLYDGTIDVFCSRYSKTLCFCIVISKNVMFGFGLSCLGN